jgi:hypothetical membrane protein
MYYAISLGGLAFMLAGILETKQTASGALLTVLGAGLAALGVYNLTRS